MQTVIDRQFFRRRRVLVVGLGVHGGGEATVRWLLRHRAVVRVTDQKTKTDLQSAVKKFTGRPVQWRLGGHHRGDFAWAEVIIQNPGVPDDLAALRWARRHDRLILNEAGLFFTLCPAAIIGVTGTRGKTTTTTLIGRMLQPTRGRVVVSGNIRRVAMLDYLDRLRATDTAVLELSSFQLEGLPQAARSPRLAVMTNLLVDHLNRYGSLQKYADAKHNIFRWQKPSDVAVLNATNAWSRRAARLTPAQVWWFQRRGRRGLRGVTIERGWLTAYGSATSRILPVSDIHVAGEHQQENILAAVTAGLAWGVPIRRIRQAVQKFAGVPHRQEQVRSWRGHEFINDTTATTPDGTLAALAVFPRGVFILGGTDKQLSFTALARVLHRRLIPVVWLPGSATTKLAQALRRAGDRRPVTPVDSMATAVRQAVAQAKSHQPIVLSPGAASFGLFAHEFDRGEQFVRQVKALR